MYGNTWHIRWKWIWYLLKYQIWNHSYSVFDFISVAPNPVSVTSMPLLPPPPPLPQPPQQAKEPKDEIVRANYARVQEELQLKLKYDECQNLTLLSIHVLNYFSIFSYIFFQKSRSSSWGSNPKGWEKGKDPKRSWIGSNSWPWKCQTKVRNSRQQKIK